MSILDLGIRDDFPLLRSAPQLVYLDNAATVQKPAVVITAETRFYEKQYANVHRGMYDLATAATTAYEATRTTIQSFINAASAAEIVFTPNATFALNQIAYLESQRLQVGDEILLSVAEHHSNLLPWQRVAQRTGAKVVWTELTPDRQSLDLNDFFQKLSSRTKVVALAHASNVLGYLLPLGEVVARAHACGARVVIDATQTAGRMPFDVQALDVDYAAFSGHKLYGPTGTGWLYGKAEYLADAEPLLSGGGAVEEVTRETVEWRASPWRYEAGTGDIDGFVALGAAIEYLQAIGMATIWQHDQALSEYMLEQLQRVSGLVLYGPSTSKKRVSIFSFGLAVHGEQVHSHDVVSVVNNFQVALRGGHHCAQPLLAELGLAEVTRASAGIYTSDADINALITALEAVQTVFSKKPSREGTRGTS